MKRFFRIFTVAIVAFVFTTLTVLSTYATELTQTEDMNDGSPVEPAIVVLPDIIDGPGGTLTKLFTMTAVNVYNNIDSYRHFNLSQVPSTSTSIYVKGLLTHSEAGNLINDAPIRIGLGTYSSTAGGVYPIFFEYPTSGVDFTRVMCNKSALYANVEYYGTITNMVSVGNINGSIGFYYVEP